MDPALDGIEQAMVAVLALCGSLLTVVVAWWGTAKIYRFFGGR